MAYKAEDFNKLPWNPLKIKQNVMDAWKPFFQYEEFKPKILSQEKSTFLNYMAIAYHMYSPLISDFTNTQERKRQAATLAGWRPASNTGKFKKSIEEIINSKNDIANRMIIRFLFLQKSMKFTALILSYENLDKLFFKIKESSNKENLGDAIDSTTKDIDIIYKALDKLEQRKDELLLGDNDLIEEADGILSEYAVPPGFPEKYAKKDHNNSSKF